MLVLEFGRFTSLPQIEENNNVRAGNMASRTTVISRKAKREIKGKSPSPTTVTLRKPRHETVGNMESLTTITSPKIKRGFFKFKKTKTVKKDAPSILVIPQEEKRSYNKQRRVRIPDRPNVRVNYWTILKSFVGRELSKIPMPVNFNEPLSFLQKLTEEFEYAELLDEADNCKDLNEQIAYVAAFIVASYSTTEKRLTKPFNPLLGETFEFDRTSDLGWKIISEQVSHHPPISAIYCESKNWIYTYDFKLFTKFSGNSVLAAPLGRPSLQFLHSGNGYTWKKVSTAVRNIMIGTMYIEHFGDMEIIGENGAQGIRCHLKFLSRKSNDEDCKVIGEVYNNNDEVKFVLNGYWNRKFEIGSINEEITSDDQISSSNIEYRTIWTRKLPPPDSGQYYNFTIFASQLNEPEERIAPTDSRKRSDIRLMEIGDWNEANKEKERLEEKQRRTRKNHESTNAIAIEQDNTEHEYKPAWFKLNEKRNEYEYQGDYWECKKNQDWSRCPDIF